MGITLILRALAVRLAGEKTLRDLRTRRITEYCLETGAKLVTVQQGAVTRYAVFGYAADGSDRSLNNLAS